MWMCPLTFIAALEKVFLVWSEQRDITPTGSQLPSDQQRQSILMMHNGDLNGSSHLKPLFVFDIFRNTVLIDLIAWYTRTAMIDVNCTPMGFTYDMCPIMLLGATARKWEEPSIYNWLESAIHKRRLSELFLMSFEYCHSACFWRFSFKVHKEITTLLHQGSPIAVSQFSSNHQTSWPFELYIV